MMMKLSIGEMIIGEKYWLDSTECVYGILDSIDEDFVCFKVDPQNNQDYILDSNNLVWFPNNTYIYKPLN
jgi:hypothetical protein